MSGRLLNTLKNDRLKPVMDIVRKIRRETNAVRGRDIHVRSRGIGGSCRMGTDYGGWEVLPALLSPSSVVYGAGVGNDISWDLALIEAVGCRVHAFDPTPRCLAFISQQTLPSLFSFHPWGFAEVDSQRTFVMRSSVPGWSSYNMSDEVSDAVETETLEVRRLTTIMQELGHDHIDLLKMDIEGAEYAVLADMFQEGVFPDQLCIEFHFDPDSKPEVLRFKQAVYSIIDQGYQAFSRSPVGHEISFVRESAEVS